MHKKLINADVTTTSENNYNQAFPLDYIFSRCFLLVWSSVEKVHLGSKSRSKQGILQRRVQVLKHFLVRLWDPTQVLRSSLSGYEISRAKGKPERDLFEYLLRTVSHEGNRKMCWKEAWNSELELEWVMEVDYRGVDQWGGESTQYVRSVPSRHWSHCEYLMQMCTGSEPKKLALVSMAG